MCINFFVGYPSTLLSTEIARYNILYYQNNISEDYFLAMKWSAVNYLSHNLATFTDSPVTDVQSL
jgi:hypothetical protein